MMRNGTAADGMTDDDDEHWNQWLEYYVGLDMREPDNFDLTLSTPDDPERYDKAVDLRRQWEDWKSSPMSTNETGGAE
jgi:hypothetical protein